MPPQNDKIIRSPLPEMPCAPQPTGHHPIQPFTLMDAGIEDEREWRTRPRSSSAPGVVATRWRGEEQRLTEVRAETPKDCHVVGITLRSSNLHFSISDRIALDGIAMPGALLITEPCVAARCIFKGPYDELHLYLPNDLIAECASELPDRPGPSLQSEVILTRDPIIERLGHTLLNVEDIGSSFGQLYLESVSTAIVARLLSRSGGSGCSKPRKATELVRWRLRRAIDYIETHLEGPITLSDMARSTGLTRMHFAAQFRAATGLRPHEYLLRRRIESAQQLLLETRLPLVEVALSVGFQSQSHFTSVFGKFVGQSPRCWRESHGGAGSRDAPSVSRVVKSGPILQCQGSADRSCCVSLTGN